MLLGLLLMGVVLIVSRDDEPRVDGRTLSEWLRLYRYTDDNTEVSNAVHRIGVEAIPILLAKLRATEPKWKRKVTQVGGGKFLPHRWLYTTHYQHEDAWHGFSFLGTQAVSAIPELSKMLFDTNTHGVSASVLGYIGADARPVLLTALTNANQGIRSAAVVGLTATTEMALASAEEVIRLVHDPDIGVAMTAASRSMSWLPPPQGLEVGIEALRDPRPIVQEYALRCLQQWVKTNRTSALPVIIPLLESSDPRLRDTATNVFREISSPQELSRGEEKQNR